MPDSADRAAEVAKVTETYYDSDDADRFYFNIWGGEDIHIGIYDDTDDIRTASRLTVERMARTAEPLNESTRVLDIGAGYGGSARYLAKSYGCPVTCLNISRIQNATNERLNAEQGLDGLIDVHYGNFEDLPEADESYDLVWSQDAILHSGRKQTVMNEVFRVLKPGGRLVFTDPMQADDCPDGVLGPVLARIHLDNLGSFAAYKELAANAGFEHEADDVMTPQLRSHYNRVREELTGDYERMCGLASKDYVDRMIQGLENWVKAADSGYLAWGIQSFRKPA